MSSAADRKKKQSWLARGVDALHRARPDVPPNLYRCPLCIRDYDSIGAVTFEDVPPRSLGGRRVVLTCRKCNSRSGHELDHHARKAADLQEFAEGKRERRVTLTAEDLNVAATAKKTPKGFAFAGVPQCSDPVHHAAFFDRLDRATSSGSMDWGFRVSLRGGYDGHAENLAWLRAGYLIAFAAMGYTYVLRPELASLRSQLEKPGEKIIPYFMAQTSEHGCKVNRLAIVFEPADLRSVLVQFGRRLVFLPDFTAGLDFFERLKGLRPGQKVLQFVGRQMPWPSEPVFALDFEPSLLPLYVPKKLAARG